MANPLIPPPTNLQTDQPPMNALIPPMPPTSPAMGFQLWASDPQNAHKVVPSMTDANAPLQPNHPSNGGMVAATPPKPMPMAVTAPPAVQMPSAPPQLAADQQKLRDLQQSGAGLNQIKNPLLHGLAKAGDIIAPFLIGGGAAAIPGTTLHNRYLQRETEGNIANEQAAYQQAQQTALNQADLNQKNTQTALAPELEQLKEQQAATQAGRYGLKVVKNDDGSTTLVPDENSPVYQQQQSKIGLAQAQIEAAQAKAEADRATAALKQAQNDPNSPAYKLAKQRADTAIANAAAAQERAEAYMGRYLQSAYNTGLQGDVLPGAPIILDNSGNQTVVGTGNAPLATKDQGKAAMFNEVTNATNQLEQKANALVQSGARLNDPKVAAAIADPKTTSAQWLQGQFANSGLTPQQRDYVIAVKAYKERLQPLRQSAGGSVSDQQVDRLMQLAPGANTPDIDYLHRQLNEIRNLQGNLSAGVTTAAGGLKVQGRDNPLAPPKAGPKGGKGNAGPKENDTKVNANGDKVVFKGGRWQLQ